MTERIDYSLSSFSFLCDFFLSRDFRLDSRLFERRLRSDRSRLRERSLLRANMKTKTEMRKTNIKESCQDFVLLQIKITVATLILYLYTGLGRVFCLYLSMVNLLRVSSKKIVGPFLQICLDHRLALDSVLCIRVPCLLHAMHFVCRPVQMADSRC